MTPAQNTTAYIQGFEDGERFTKAKILQEMESDKREWVGLTLEQYVAINSSCTTVDQAVGSTERQLKENNTCQDQNQK